MTALAASRFAADPRAASVMADRRVRRGSTLRRGTGGGGFGGSFRDGTLGGSHEASAPSSLGIASTMVGAGASAGTGMLEEAPVEDYLNDLPKRDVPLCEGGSQTEAFVELIRASVSTAGAGTQTDGELARPLGDGASRAQRKLGPDAECQADVSPSFDELAAPVLHVLVARALRDGALAAAEALDQLAVFEQRQEFENDRLAVVADVRSAEAATDRRRREKETRLQESYWLQPRQRGDASRDAARAAAAAALRGAEERVLEGLEAAGLFGGDGDGRIAGVVVPRLLRAAAKKADEVAGQDEVGRETAAAAVGSLLGRRKAVLSQRLAARDAVDGASSVLNALRKEEAQLAEEEGARVASEQAAAKEWASPTAPGSDEE